MLLLGSPGQGKSILGHHMAIDWSCIQTTGKTCTGTATDVEGQKICKEHLEGSQENLTIDQTKDEEQFLKQFSLLLHIDLSQVRAESTLSDVISQQILVDRRENIEWFLDYVTLHQEKCLIILDGWDEYNPSSCPDVTKIANNHSFPGATVLITSRIREHTVLPKAVDAQCMIRGFNKAQAKKFVEKILKLGQCLTPADNLVRFVTDNNLWGVFSVPLMLTYLCLLYMSGSKLREKVTDLFHGIIKLCLGRHCLKNMKLKSAAVQVTMDQFENELCNLGKLAYHGLANENTRTVFSKDEAVDMGGEKILDIGLLQKVRSQDPMSSSCLVTFGHKSIQEFVAAIYLTQFQDAFDLFFEYIDSLIKIYDTQLLVTFVCGLNPDMGRQLIEKVKAISKSKTATAAECPEFSYRGWTTDKLDVYDRAWRQVIVASDVTPLLIQCCWEMLDSGQRVKFPFTHGKDQSAITLEPNINLNIVNLHCLSELLKRSKVSLTEGGKIKLYNMAGSKENQQETNRMIEHLSENSSKFSVLDVTNVKSSIKMKGFPKLLDTPLELICIKNVKLLKPDMLVLLQRLSQQTSLVELCLNRVILVGCEFALCEAICHLIALRVLRLKSLCVAGFETQLCEAISHLEHLQSINLYKTNFAPADNAFPDCLSKLTLSLFKYLDLADTKLTEDQTRDVVKLLPLCPDLLLLSLRGLPMYAAVDELQDVLPKSKQLQGLDAHRGGLNTQQLVSVISSLPASVKMLYAQGNHIQDDIMSVTKVLPSLPNLEFVTLDTDSISDDVSSELNEAFVEDGVLLVGKNDESMAAEWCRIFLLCS